MDRRRRAPLVERSFRTKECPMYGGEHLVSTSMKIPDGHYYGALLQAGKHK